MQLQIVLLIILGMVCLLCHSIWEQDPTEQVRFAQETRVKAVATLSFR